MYAVWCAKEALYKYYGMKALDFKDHLRLEYSPLKKSNRLTGYISKDTYFKKLDLWYEHWENYIIVHTE